MIHKSIKVSEICTDNPPRGWVALQEPFASALKQDLNHQGMVQAVQVVETNKYPGFKYWLANGYHRIGWAKENGLEEVQAEIFDDATDRLNAQAAQDANARVMVLLWCAGDAEMYERHTGKKLMEGPWTLVLPEALRLSESEPVKFGMGNPDQGISVGLSSTQARYLWLSLVRDEELIEKAGEVCKSPDGSIRHHNAIEALRTCLRMRGREV